MSIRCNSFVGKCLCAHNHVSMNTHKVFYTVVKCYCTINLSSADVHRDKTDYADSEMHKPMATQLLKITFRVPVLSSQVLRIYSKLSRPISGVCLKHVPRLTKQSCHCRHKHFQHIGNLQVQCFIFSI